MSGYAAVRGRCGRQAARGIPAWAKDYLRRAALAALGCAVIGRPTAGLNLLPVDHPQRCGIRLVLKGLFDRCAAAALILLFPLMAVIGAIIRLHDRGPAFFTQARVGKDGRVFRICKFRAINDTLVRTSQIRHDRLPETDNFVCRQTYREAIKVRSACVSV